MQIKEEIKKICPQVKFNEPLAKHTSFRIGGPAEYFVEVRNRSELVNLLRIAKKYNLDIFVIGAGTNLLVKDKGVKGSVVKLSGEFKKIDFSGEKVKIGGGVLLPQLIKLCAQNNLGGIEFLAGIPGTVGGALVTNAGNPEKGIGSLVNHVELMTYAGKTKIMDKKNLDFFYRGSNIPEDAFILSAKMSLKKTNKDIIKQRISKQLKKRWLTQPRKPYQAGSIFKNPPGDYAGRLIEQANLKGLKYGNAYVSEKHANFIINQGKAKAKEVIYLIRKIKDTVKKKFGIKLELEIRIIGN